MGYGKIEIDGFELGYCIEGKGETTFVIGSSIYYPRVFSQALRSHLRMVFMDHRGFAQNNNIPQIKEYNNGLFELEKLVDDIEALRQKLNIKKFALIGHSGHGYIVLEYAKKYPQVVSNIILIAMSASSDDESFEAADRYLDESVCPERKDVLKENMQKLALDVETDPLRKFIHYSLRSGARIWYDYNFDAKYLWNDVKLIPEMFDYVWGNLFKKIDICKSLDNLTNTKILLMLGRYDYWNPPYLWEPIKKKFKNITCKIFEKSGHTPQMEETQAFDNELLDFLNIRQKAKSNIVNSKEKNKDKLAKSLRANLIRRKTKQKYGSVE